MSLHLELLQLLGLYCVGAVLVFTFTNFVEFFWSFQHLLFLVVLELQIVMFPLLYGTFWNFSQTKEENRIPKLKPKPRMNFLTQAKQIVSQEQ